MREALDLAFAIGCVLAVWMGMLVLLAGLGWGLLRLMAGRSTEAPDLTTAAWAGYAATIAVLQVWHFALPVDGRALAFLAILSAAGWWAGRGAALSGDRLPRSVRVVLGITLGLAAIWLADRSIGPCFSYDSANYQIPLVRWYRSDPVVPGLANLNPLYGLGSSGLLFAALFEPGTMAGWSHHFTNGFLLFLLLLLLARFLGDLCGGTSRPGSRHAAALALLFPTVMLINRSAASWISSPTTDLPVAAAVFAAWCLIAEGLAEGRLEAARPGSHLFTGLSLLAVAPCLKATAAVFAGTAWVVVCGLWLARKGGGQGWRKRGDGGGTAVAFAAIAILPWLARNVMLSGYPLFPAAVAGFPVDWRLPVEHAEGIVWWTRAYLRMPEAWERMTAPGFAEWFPFWIRAELRVSLLEAVIPLVLAAAASAVWLFLRRRQVETRPPAALLLPFAVALPVWFLSAPSVRYCLFLFWSLCAQTAAMVLPQLLAKPGVRRFLPALTLLWAVSPLVFQAHYAVKYRGALTPRAALVWQFLTPPGPDHGFHPLFQPALDTVRVCGSLDVHLPAARIDVREPAPWPETLPWDSPPPSTALLLPGLCPRQPGNLAAGFRIADSERPWAERHAAMVLAVAERTGWPVARLAVYFVVRPELIEKSLQLAGRRARP